MRVTFDRGDGHDYAIAMLKHAVGIDALCNDPMTGGVFSVRDATAHFHDGRQTVQLLCLAQTAGRRRGSGVVDWPQKDGRDATMVVFRFDSDTRAEWDRNFGFSERCDSNYDYALGVMYNVLTFVEPMRERGNITRDMRRTITDLVVSRRRSLESYVSSLRNSPLSSGRGVADMFDEMFPQSLREQTTESIADMARKLTGNVAKDLKSEVVAEAGRIGAWLRLAISNDPSLHARASAAGYELDSVSCVERTRTGARRINIVVMTRNGEPIQSTRSVSNGARIADWPDLGITEATQVLREVATLIADNQPQRRDPGRGMAV